MAHKKKRSFGSTKETHRYHARVYIGSYRKMVKHFRTSVRDGKCSDALMSLIDAVALRTAMKEHARHARTKPHKTTGRAAFYETERKMRIAFRTACMR